MSLHIERTSIVVASARALQMNVYYGILSLKIPFGNFVWRIFHFVYLRSLFSPALLCHLIVFFSALQWMHRKSPPFNRINSYIPPFSTRLFTIFLFNIIFRWFYFVLLSFSSSLQVRTAYHIKWVAKRGGSSASNGAYFYFSFLFWLCCSCQRIFSLFFLIFYRKFLTLLRPWTWVRRRTRVLASCMCFVLLSCHYNFSIRLYAVHYIRWKKRCRFHRFYLFEMCDFFLIARHLLKAQRGE